MKDLHQHKEIPALKGDMVIGFTSGFSITWFILTYFSLTGYKTSLAISFGLGLLIVYILKFIIVHESYEKQSEPNTPFIIWRGYKN
jgi:hypothetical protein